MKELVEYINSLKNGSFEGWSEKEKNGYLTAIDSILCKIEDLYEKEAKNKTGTENSRM